MREERENGKRERGGFLFLSSLALSAFCVSLALLSKNIDCGFSF
jgi:hypothetical protein